MDNEFSGGKNTTGKSPRCTILYFIMPSRRPSGICYLADLSQKDLKWNKHVEETTRKAVKNLYCLKECTVDERTYQSKWISQLI
jgi:hypothetical protein